MLRSWGAVNPNENKQYLQYTMIRNHRTSLLV